MVLAFLGLALAAGVFVPSHGARAATGYVQSAMHGAGGTTSVAVPFNRYVVKNDIVAVFVDFAAGITLNSVTDNEGNVYTLVDNPTTGSSGNLAAMAYAVIGSSGPLTVTANFSGSTNCAIAIHEITGVQTASPLDQHRMNAQSGPGSGQDAATSGTVNTNTSGDYIFGIIWNDGSNSATYAAGTGYILRQQSDPSLGSATQQTEDAVQTSKGSVAATFEVNPGFASYITGIMAFRPAFGIQVSNRSDTLSNSQPSSTSNHTIAFTVNNSIMGSSASNSSTLTIILPGAFTIPSNMDCGDVDAATSSQFNFNYPGCQATATAWGFSATGSVIMLVPPSGTGEYMATNTQITIKIGSNATQQQTGAHWITNPSTPGVYIISVGGTFGGSGNMLVSINSGQTVSATMAENLSFTVSSVHAVNCTADDGATVNTVTTSATSVPFGFISSNIFYQGCQDLYVSTNAEGGYSVTVQEKYAMRTANGQLTIPDTTCDAGNCTVATATTWVTPTNYGLGHTCANVSGSDCAGVYANGTKFRPLANTAAGTVQNGWYNSNWGYRKRIRIASSQVTGSATSFPVLISSTDPAWRYTSFGGHVGSATGWDFVVTDANGVTKLDYEIDSYASSTGALVAWARVPFLSTTTVNELFVYYGNASAPNQQNPAGVWASSYQGVWHLPNGSTLTANDSTGNGNNGSNNGAAAVTGKIDGGASLNGSSYIDAGNNSSLQLTTTGSVSAWVKYGTNPDNTVILDNGDFENDFNGYSLGISGSPHDQMIVCELMGASSHYNIFGTIAHNDNLWHKVDCVWNGTGANSAHLYIDGVDEAPSTPTVVPTTGSNLNFGRDVVNNNAYFTGSLDEIRVSNVARSASWIQTEYNNQNSSSAFYSVFPEELQGSAGQVIMANAGPVASAVSRAKYRLSVPSNQPAGTYTTVITYTILGTF